MRYFYDNRGRPAGYSVGPVGRKRNEYIEVALILLVIGAIIAAVVIFAVVVVGVVLGVIVLGVLIAITAPVVEKVGYRMRGRNLGELPRHDRELDITEAARYLGLKTDKVRLLVKHKQIPSHVPKGVECYGTLAPPVFDRFELRQWAQTHGTWLGNARRPASKGRATFAPDSPAVGAYAESSEPGLGPDPQTGRAG